MTRQGILSWSKRTAARQPSDIRGKLPDPLSIEGDRELYWRRRSADVSSEALAFAHESRRALASLAKEAEKSAQPTGRRVFSSPIAALFTGGAPAHHREQHGAQHGGHHNRGRILVEAKSAGDEKKFGRNLFSLDATAVLESDSEATSLLSFHPSEALVATADEHTTLSLWDLEAGEKCWEAGKGVGGALRSIEWVNGRGGPSRLAAGEESGVVRVWAAAEDDLEASSPRMVTALAAVPDLEAPSLTDAREGGLVTFFAPEAGHLVAGGQSPMLRVWDLSAERCTSCWLADPVGKSSVTSLCCGKGSGVLGPHALLAGFGDGSLRIVDVRLPGDRNVVASWRDHDAWVL